jgi:hypothetical protein
VTDLGADRVNVHDLMRFNSEFVSKENNESELQDAKRSEQRI